MEMASYLSSKKGLKGVSYTTAKKEVHKECETW
jgi:hypothetical protein